MSFQPASTRVTCPNCQNQFTAKIHNIIDISQNPELKDKLLSGQLNTVTCPQCGMSNQLGVPLVYHDPDNEVLIAYVPNELNMQMEEEEKLIGQLTNKVMEATPAEQRKRYMLEPERVMTMQSLAEKILEADGISREDIQRQNEVIQLLLRMAQVADNEEALKALYEENEDIVDYQFLVMLAGTVEASRERGDAQLAEKLQAVQEKLVEWADISPAEVPQLNRDAGYDELIETLRETEDERLTAVVAANRPLLDYGFFMHLTEQIESATDDAEQKELEQLRARLNEITDTMDREAREAMERATQQLQEILQSDDVAAAVKERMGDLDDAFLAVLSANIDAAKNQGRTQVVDRLQEVYEIVVEEAEKNLRPELRTVNQLIRTESREESERILREALTTYNPAGFIEMLEMLMADIENQGVNPGLLQRLEDIIEQAREVQDTMQTESV